MKSEFPLTEIMTGAAVQELLEISRATLFRMEKRGEIPAYKYAGKKFYRRSEIMAAITASRVEITPTEATQAA
jgi:hypothetical protein